ncbi:regulator of G-protein signaling [Acrasis kona]|uniref:Regulator of G-protein signaling n=1 Tax=Acrasis kona TaxID=1008807 RepID=A0AAW2YXJ3_9EUKA
MSLTPKPSLRDLFKIKKKTPERAHITSPSSPGSVTSNQIDQDLARILSPKAPSAYDDFQFSLVMSVLEDEDMRQEFSTFAVNEFNYESLCAWTNIQKYHGCQSEEGRKELAVFIFENFVLHHNTRLCQSIPRSVRMEVREKIDRNEFDDKLFFGVEEAVMYRLCRIFERFSKTEEYRRFMGNNVKQELKRASTIKGSPIPSLLKSPLSASPAGSSPSKSPKKSPRWIRSLFSS